jgi:hypothetical protein
MTGSRAKEGRWPHALTRAILLITISIVGFLVVPDLLARQLSIVASATVRDAAVLTWFIGCIVATSWVLVRVQRSSQERVPAETDEDQT